MNTTLNSAVPFRIGIGLQGTGFHPASGADPQQRHKIFTAGYWADNVQQAERAGASFVTLEDSLGLQGHGQFDASLVASWVAPRTHRIGLIPTVTVTHTEPFHVSKNIATLDHISSGRAGWQVQVSNTVEESRLFGRGRHQLDLASLYAEAEEAVEVSRRMWDSWEDDAEIRDLETGRFIDREKLHYIDYEGEHFSVKGPSITPRSPQGQPVIAFAGRDDAVLQAAVHGGDLLFVSVVDETDAKQLLETIRGLETTLVRTGAPLLVYVDLPLVLAEDEATARQRWETLNLEKPAWLNADQLRALGTPQDVTALITRLKTLGFNGVRLLTAENAVDLPAIHNLLADQLGNAGIELPHQPISDAKAPSLREQLGLTRPENRYTTAPQVTGATA